MKNNRGFTLIELLAVIVVLAVVMVMATTTILPYMSTARESAFRTEATDAVNSASNALNLYNLGELEVKNDTNSCVTRNKKACFTIDSLIDAGIYDTDKGTFEGKVVIDMTDPKNYTYTLYFKKGDEFILNGVTARNFQSNGELTQEWADGNKTCSCT